MPRELSRQTRQHRLENQNRRALCDAYILQIVPSLIVLQELAVSTTISKRGPCIGGLPFHLKRCCTDYLLPRHPLVGEGTYIWGPESQLVHCRGDSCNDSLRPQSPQFCSDALPSSCPGLSAGCCAQLSSSTNCDPVDAGMRQSVCSIADTLESLGFNKPGVAPLICKRLDQTHSGRYGR